ncbi:MAG: hypothetical protein WCJ64_03450 [Rhodospirillaceae bacterium]
MDSRDRLSIFVILGTPPANVDGVLFQVGGYGIVDDHGHACLEDERLGLAGHHQHVEFTANERGAQLAGNTFCTQLQYFWRTACVSATTMGGQGFAEIWGRARRMAGCADGGHRLVLLGLG